MPPTDTIAFAIEPFALSVEQAAKLTGVGQTKLWEEIKAGRLRHVRRCGRVLVRPADARTWIDRGLSPAPPPEPR
jgi:excisionase family DNA binding protein